MILQKIEDFDVWKKAEALSVAITAILARPGFSKEFSLRSQIRDAVDSVLSNMSEGFEQPTDRAFANYLYRVKGSAAETCTRLGIAYRRNLVSKEELRDLVQRGEEVGKMTSGLIRHLMKTPDRRRGLGV